MSDDPARKILGSDWQIPTKAIWEALNTSSYKWTWTTKKNKNGMEVKNNSTINSIFLPAAGYVRAKNFSERGSGARYWSGTAYSSLNAYRLSFSDSKLNVKHDLARQYGCSVRPVRLVAVD
ncbi:MULTISPECIES: hypothetical protein [unclassified Prevotella]|uniref:hypothetical protein n=1 Tax=unclassified Prevotella TaxID=2638335 RepID=UPI0020B13A06|nr:MULTISPECIES: hypothetical protein [unclassified Prevotella]